MQDSNGKEPKVLLAVILKADGKTEWKSELDLFRINLLLDELKLEVIRLCKDQAQIQMSGPVEVKEETPEQTPHVD